MYKKLLILLLIIFVASNVSALTVLDTFEDGDSNNNPTWGVISGGVDVNTDAKHDGLFGFVVGSNAALGSTVYELPTPIDANDLNIEFWMNAKAGNANNHHFMITWEDTNGFVTNSIRINNEAGAGGIHQDTYIGGANVDSGLITAGALNIWNKYSVRIDTNGESMLTEVYDPDGTTLLGNTYMKIPQGQVKRILIRGERITYVDTIFWNGPILASTVSIISEINPKDVSIDFNSIPDPQIGVSATDYNWTVDSIVESFDQNFVFKPIVAFTDYNACVNVVFDDANQAYACSTVNSGKIFGDTNFLFFDGNTGGPLSVTLDFNGTSYTGTSFYLPSNQIAGSVNEQITFNLTKTNYSDRFYSIDMNHFTDLNVAFMMLESNLSTNVPLKVYKTDETTLFTNTYVEIFRPDQNNWVVGRRKTNDSGETNFNLNLSDQNYLFNVNNGEFVYQPVALTILYPKNEETLLQIEEDWRVDITNNYFASFINLTSSKVVYLLPNTASAFDIKIADMNGNYFSRTYAKIYPGNPLTDTLQPYLVKIDEGILTTLKTISSFTNQPINGITIVIYKNISGEGRTLVEQVVTDFKGEALTLLNVNDTYEFEIFDRDLVFIRTDSYTGTSSTVFIRLAIQELTDPILNNYIVSQAFTPNRTKLISTDLNLVQTTTLSNLGTSVLIDRIDYWITNTDQNGTGIDKNIYSIFVTPFSTSHVNGFDINQEYQTIEGQHYDTNGFLVVNVLITLSDGNKFFYQYKYSPKPSFDWLYQAGIGMRGIFGCTGTDPNIPCPIMMLTALFLSLIITIALAIETGFTSMEGMGFILLAVLGIFTYFSWIPYLLYGIMVVSAIVIGIALGGKKI